jgi:hypothetical protein
VPDRPEALPAREAPDVSARPDHPPLPEWLANRVLHEDETVTWVYGPRHSPAVEPFLTHPLLFVAALALGALLVWAATLVGGSDVVAVASLAAGALVLGSIFTLGICSGYFTRLVVTDSRLIIIQGREAYKSWDVNDLPVSLLRYGRPGGGVATPSINLDAVKGMLGGPSDRIVSAQAILDFGKRLEQIRSRDGDRP